MPVEDRMIRYAISLAQRRDRPPRLPPMSSSTKGSASFVRRPRIKSARSPRVTVSSSATQRRVGGSGRRLISARGRHPATWAGPTRAPRRTGCRSRPRARCDSAAAGARWPAGPSGVHPLRDPAEAAEPVVHGVHARHHREETCAVQTLPVALSRRMCCSPRLERHPERGLPVLVAGDADDVPRHEALVRLLGREEGGVCRRSPSERRSAGCCRPRCPHPTRPAEPASSARGGRWRRRPGCRRRGPARTGAEVTDAPSVAGTGPAPR